MSNCIRCNSKSDIKRFKFLSKDTVSFCKSCLSSGNVHFVKDSSGNLIQVIYEKV